jgi:hypothetical protein
VNQIGDFFVKLFFNLVGLAFAIATLGYGIYLQAPLIASLAFVSVISGLLLITLSMEQIRSILNILSNQSEPPQRLFNQHAEGGLTKTDIESESKAKETGAAKTQDIVELRKTSEIPDRLVDTYEFLEVIKKSKSDNAFGQLEFIDEIYKKMKPYLYGERGLIISGSSQARGAYAPTIKQVLAGEKLLDQLICKNIYPDLDLISDTEINFSSDRRVLESLLMGLWSDYYRVVVLVEDWDEEFWRALARRVNTKLSLDKSKDWLNLPAIKRKRPVTYQNLSRFDNSENLKNN